MQQWSEKEKIAADLRNIALRSQVASSPGRPARLEKILSPAIVFLCYWHPGLKRHKFRALRDYVKELLLKVAAHITARPMDVATEFTDVHISKPPTQASACSLAQFILYWQGVEATYPMLCKAIIAIAKLHPTEADCERVFSSLKWMFDRLRTTAKEDLVETTVCGASAVNFLHNAVFDEVDFSAPRQAAADTEEEQAQVSREYSHLTVEHAEAILTLYHKEVVEPAAAQARENVGPNNAACGRCGNEDVPDDLSVDSDDSDFNDPSGATNWIQCTVCQTWFHNCCVRVSPAAGRSHHWRCETCVGTGATVID
jgi:hypothetical protein